MNESSFFATYYTIIYVELIFEEEYNGYLVLF